MFIRNLTRLIARLKSAHGTKPSGRCMSVIGGKADVPELGPDFRF
jgi:hypothetical protein